MSRKIILIKQELLLLVYELNRSGLLAENEKIRPILAQLEKLLLCDLSPLINFFFLNDPATTEIYTLSLHDALPIFGAKTGRDGIHGATMASAEFDDQTESKRDRKSTRLNSSHPSISYAVFCLK